MLLKTELEQWLSTLAADDYVAVDDGGLTLRSIRNDDAYLEVGGIPEEVCPKSPDCRHEPDFSTVSVNSDGDQHYVDVNCKYCGRSGCVHTLNSEDVDW